MTKQMVQNLSLIGVVLVLLLFLATQIKSQATIQAAGQNIQAVENMFSRPVAINDSEPPIWSSPKQLPKKGGQTLHGAIIFSGYGTIFWDCVMGKSFRYEFEPDRWFSQNPKEWLDRLPDGSTCQDKWDSLVRGLQALATKYTFPAGFFDIWISKLQGR